MSSSDKETYLGDGLYASYDGFQIKLRAPRGYEDHEVFLEPHTLQSFKLFLKHKVEKQIKEDEESCN